MRSTPDGWVLDAYSDPLRGEMVLWVRTEGGATRIAEPFLPALHVRARSEGALSELADALTLLRAVGEPEIVEGICGLDEAPSRVLRVPIKDHRQVLNVAQTIDARGDFRDLEVFDADLRMAHRYFLAKRLWPLAKVRAWAPGRFRLLESDRWSHEYELPPLRLLDVGGEADLAAGALPTSDTPLKRVWVGEPWGLEGERGAECAETFEGEEEEMLRWLAERVARIDPDVILTKNGDTFLLPYLHGRAAALDVDFFLGRERDPAKPRRAGKSYFSYGKIKYQAPSYALHGRLHIDRASSFFYAEAGLHGLIDLSRISNVPLQDVARLGAGTALTAIQIDLAASQGRLIPWKKNVPESFKTARGLLLADRGGYIFEPRVGLHEDVVELDFASLYPNIMAKHNISPETVLCTCCDVETGRAVPQLGSWTCAKRAGFIPKYIEPIIRRREHYKKQRKRDPERRARYQEICDIYKWLLVTSFGYQGYKNAKFGRIECHEAISAWARETLLAAGEVARDHGYELLHGIVDSLWLERVSPGSDVLSLGEAVGKELGIPFEYQGRYKWIVFLPNRTGLVGAAPAVGALNRYYGCFDAPPDKPSRSQAGQPLDYIAKGAMKVRGIELRQHSSPRIVREAQERYLEVVARADDAREFMALLPEAVAATRATLERVQEGRCELKDLIITAAISKEPEHYSVVTGPSAALKQLARRGLEVPPGDVVKFVVTDASSRDPETKVVEARIMKGDEDYDAEFYSRLVLRAVASLTLPFGLDEEALAHRLGDTRQLRLEKYAVI